MKKSSIIGILIYVGFISNPLPAHAVLIEKINTNTESNSTSIPTSSPTSAPTNILSLEQPTQTPKTDIGTDSKKELQGVPSHIKCGNCIEVIQSTGVPKNGNTNPEVVPSQSPLQPIVGVTKTAVKKTILTSQKIASSSVQASRSATPSAKQKPKPTSPHREQIKNSNIVNQLITWIKTIFK